MPELVQNCGILNYHNDNSCVHGCLRIRKHRCIYIDAAIRMVAISKQNLISALSVAHNYTRILYRGNCFDISLYSLYENDVKNRSFSGSDIFFYLLHFRILS